ncbi:MAG: hypothetical protein QOE70_2298 [Chthoniobacter sp.]|jgi:hypothetical protein|nr:hypothetical protein [Chthoniobacter sp.]
MKRIAFSFVACLAVAGSALAGHEMKESKEYKEPVVEPCFKDTELQLDLFGSYTDTEGGGYTDGFGGGVGVNFFFMRYLGVGADANIFDGGVNGVWNFSGSLIARFPVELGGLCLAPYIFGGGGVQTDGITSGTVHAGGGLEFRVVPQRLGIFAEGRYTWASGSDDSTQVRTGVRVVF